MVSALAVECGDGHRNGTTHEVHSTITSPMYFSCLQAHLEHHLYQCFEVVTRELLLLVTVLVVVVICFRIRQRKRTPAISKVSALRNLSSDLLQTTPTTGTQTQLIPRNIHQ